MVVHFGREHALHLVTLAPCCVFELATRLHNVLRRNENNGNSRLDPELHFSSDSFRRSPTIWRDIIRRKSSENMAYDGNYFGGLLGNNEHVLHFHQNYRASETGSVN